MPRVVWPRPEVSGEGQWSPDWTTLSAHRPAEGGTRFLMGKVRSMTRKQRQVLIDRDHQLSLMRQCNLFDVSRASVYYRPARTRSEDLEMRAPMDRQHPWAGSGEALETPFYGSRRMRGPAAGRGTPGQPEEGPPVDAIDGSEGYLSASQHQPPALGFPSRIKEM